MLLCTDEFFHGGGGGIPRDGMFGKQRFRSDVSGKVFQTQRTFWQNPEFAEIRRRVSSVSLAAWAISERGRSEAHAAFQFEWFAKSTVLGDRRFDILGENFGRDHG